MHGDQLTISHDRRVAAFQIQSHWSELSTSMATKIAGTEQSVYDDRVELSTAAKNGDVERVLAILERTGMDVNFDPPFLQNFRVVSPPLFAACQAGQLEVVKGLLKLKGIQVNRMFGNLTPLSEAVKGGYVEILRLLIDHGTNLNDRPVILCNTLIKAVCNGHYEATALLLEKGANPNYTPIMTSSSPLVLAAHNGYSNIVELLLDKGANIEPEYLNISPSALIRACSRGHTECARLLIERGANLNARSSDGTPLTCAVYKHHTECAELLLEKGADVNQSRDANMDETPLMTASQMGHIDQVQLLLKYGANVAAEEKRDRLTALYEACHNDHLEVAKVLIENGADFNQIPDKALEILLEVIERKYSDLACLLIQNGARVDTSNSSGETPLTRAVQSKEMKVIQVLVECGAPIDPEAISRSIRTRNSSITSFLLQKADRDTVHEMNGDLVQAAVDGDHNFAEVILPHVRDLNVRFKSGNTALMEAAKRGKEKHVNLLFERGAQVNMQNANGYTALMMAGQGGHTKCVEQLLTQKDINVNLQNSKEYTALMLASENRHTNVVELLLVNNADIEIVTTRGCSALFNGVKSNSPAVVKVLLARGADVNRKTLDEKTIIQYAYECHKEPDLRVIEMLKEAQAKGTLVQSDTPTLKEALRLLLPLAHEWEMIGVLLGIRIGDLKTIAADTTTAVSGLREMLRKWLSHVNPRQAWSSLAEAVELFNPRKAKEIRQKYCSNEVSPASETHQSDEDQDTVEEQKEEHTKESVENLEDSEDESNTENTDNPSNEEHFAAVEKAMTEKGTLKHTLSHGAMVGPARSGKSSLMSRLAGEMPISNSPSTGVAEKVVQVVGVRKSHTVALSVHDTIWFKLLYDQEAIRLMKLTTQSIPSQPQPAAPLTDSTVTSPPTLKTTTPATEQPHEQGLSATVEILAPYPKGYIAPMEVFKGAIQEEGLLIESLRHNFENSWSFYLTDTGGQVEFQELFPLLVSGPSVFFFTFRLDQELDQRFTIEYHLPDGARSKPYQSTLTVVEAILQTLASVASMGVKDDAPQVKSASLKPKMFIVGTHKDKLNAATADSEIKKIDEHLQQVIMSTSHYEEDIVQFASESQLIFTVNNFSEDDSDFKEIRSSVEHVVSHSEFQVHFPTHWLIFSLVLRQEMIMDSIISYEQCFSIAKDCGITDRDELNNALWFLHTKVGLIRHFPKPGLQDFVIRDPQILFDMVTKLIVDTFTFENLRSKLRSSDFIKKGIFTLKDFEKGNKELCPMPPKYFLEILKQLQIVAPFQEEGQDKFFIPCVLAHSEGSESPSLPQSSDVPPLLITFKCGYCPKGLTGALITYLLTNKMGSKFKWQLKTDQIFRNEVSFLVSSCDIITLKIHPTFLELIHSSARVTTEDTGYARQSKICDKVRCCVENGIRSVSDQIKFFSNAEHSLSFYCQNSKCNEQSAHNPHPATLIVEDDDGTRHLLCKELGGSEVSDLPQGSSIWFKREKQTQGTGNSETLSVNDTELNPPSTTKPGSQDITEVVKIKDGDWEEIVECLEKLDESQIIRVGVVLGLNVFRLEKMKTLPDDMVRAWLRKESEVTERCGDPLTWEALVRALEEIDQRGVANDIRESKCKWKGSNKAAAGIIPIPQKPSVMDKSQTNSHSRNHSSSRSRTHSRDRPRRQSRSHSPRGLISSHGHYRSPPRRRYRSQFCSRSQSPPRHRRDSYYHGRRSWSRSRSRSPRDRRRRSRERRRSRDRDRNRGHRSHSKKSRDRDRDGSRKHSRSSPSEKQSTKKKKRHHKIPACTSSSSESSKPPRTKERRKK